MTINGQAFPHLLYQFVLTYSNVEAVRVCFGETFEALRDQRRTSASSSWESFRPNTVPTI